MATKPSIAPVDDWQLHGSHATLRTASLSGEVDVERPMRGVAGLRIFGNAFIGRIFAVGVEAGDGAAHCRDEPWPVGDAYVRGRDLVATYREPLGQPFDLQVYWRVSEVTSKDQPTLDAIVSVQTPRWEAYPCITVTTAMPGERLTVEQSLGLRLAEDWLYVEANRPGDFTLSSAPIAADGLLASQWRFANQFMERGVIRRLHLRGAFKRDGEVQALAAQLRADLVAEQPPLTA